MGETRIKHCDICKKTAEVLHGLCITVGFSRGGWGKRQNSVDWSGEVCEDCFKLRSVMSHQFQRTMAELVKPVKPAAVPTATAHLVDLPRLPRWIGRLLGCKP